MASIVAKMPKCQSVDHSDKLAALVSLGKVGRADPQGVLLRNGVFAGWLPQPRSSW